MITYLFMKEYSINEYELVAILDYYTNILLKKEAKTIWLKTNRYTFLGVLLNDLYLCDIDLYLRLTVEFNSPDLIVIPFYSRIEIYEKKNN